MESALWNTEGNIRQRMKVEEELGARAVYEFRRFGAIFVYGTVNPVYRMYGKNASFFHTMKRIESTSIGAGMIVIPVGCSSTRSQE
ncbi:hypothetical protein NL676_026158 [Syzygium grande]|nr:hypothetical protein NL676_026158 [Syzygium grande]